MATDARERLIADSQFGVAITINSVIYSPGTWYLGLSKTTPNEDGSNFTEPVGAGYSRVPVTNNFTNFPAAFTELGVTIKRNGTKFTFPTPTGLWGLMTDFGWFTTSTGGIPQFTHPLDTPITVQNGNTPVEFDVGQLEMVWD